MRAADLLTLITTSPTKREYQGIYCDLHDHLQALTSIQRKGDNQCVFLFEPNKPNLPMKELLVFLMKNREKEILYQKGQEFYPLYGVKERANQLVI
ncbi:hypothetical protein [Enterococcus hirae]|uniref:hypothetical protein n=1 Tax=Enterococcus hirae TaxID=1354 RepID=UPI001A9637C8|nr:hypothetical protein [Enterococcus hirae]MBO1101590.1 hypothetical protein [Enterococcus hirae]